LPIPDCLMLGLTRFYRDCISPALQRSDQTDGAISQTWVPMTG
jgi:hypothetical protein